ncbi:MAG: aminoacyl-tRNA hydrolase [Gammaproteobacteria bacterium]|nr:MAG: aminoacyl-tRNA hydrolase [Gammaproteobacteria bacterium]
MSKFKGIRLIAGLGNPGEKHAQTRHNAGFWFVDTLACRENATFKLETKFKGEVAHFSCQGEKIWLLKPQTYMNDSGESLRPFCDFYKISPEQVLVAHDEIDLPNGEAKIKWAGGHGGHNGLRSIFSHLSRDIWRLRLGVGHPGHKDQVVGYVLKQISKSDRAAVDDVIIDAMNTIEDCVSGDLEAAMRRLHSK